MKAKFTLKKTLTALMCISLLVCFSFPSVASESLDLDTIESQIEDLEQRVSALESENNVLKEQGETSEENTENSDNEEQTDTTIDDALNDSRYVMAAYAIDAAYNNAKVPFTLRIKDIYYDKDWKNGNGDVADRVILEGYAQNSLGGYDLLYAEVLKASDSVFYNAVQYDDGYYYSILVLDSDPSAGPGEYLDVATALSVYQKIYDTDREIPYDE